MTNAGNLASRRPEYAHTFLFGQFICWRAVLAFFTTILGCLNLDPLPGPENVVVVTCGAICAALSPFSPGTFSIFRARLWWLWQARWATRNDLLLVAFRAFLAAMFSLHGDNERPTLGALGVVHARVLRASL